jgi:hypothetical protein
VTKLVWTFLALLVGVFSGLGLTAIAVEDPPNFGVIEAGAWMTRPRIGAVDADPYSRALMATRGEIPLGAAEGVTLTAVADADKRPLSGRCIYRFHGPIPSARYWTLTAYNQAGTPLGGSRQRSSFTSAEVVRNHLGNAEIVLSPTPQPGNWIPLDPNRPFELALRLYDAQVSGNARAIDAASVPRLTREACP